MDKKSFELLYEDTEKALHKGYLTDALQSLKGILFAIDQIELKNEIESVEQDYKMMLQFMKSGGNDPGRAEIHHNLILRTFALLENSAREFHIIHGKDLFATKARELHTDGDNEIEKISLRLEVAANEGTTSVMFEQYDRLFNWIWTEKIENKHEAAILNALIEQQPQEMQAYLLSAVFLNMWTHFDANKFRILLAFCHSENTMVRARALTYLIWCYMRYNDRIKLYPEIIQGIRLLKDDSRIKDELMILQRQFVLTLETSKAEKKLQDEIFPNMLKSKNYARNKMGFEEAEEELAKALRGEPNAEWEKLGNNKKLVDNMKAIIEMSKEGVDINMGTFSALKGFPFFQKIEHWFAPFDYRREEIKNVISQNGNEKNNPLSMLMEAGSFCDSDKYSLCLMISQLPDGQKNMMISQFGSQMEGNEEVLKDAAKITNNAVSEYRNLMQNMYRFFKLYTMRYLFKDPFKMDLLFTSYSELCSLIESTDFYKEMAGFLLKKDYYEVTIEYLSKIIDIEGPTAEMLQKIAYCHQHLGDMKKAIFYYQQADILVPENEWILKQMHLCYSAMANYEKELECLLKLEQLKPDNAKIISETGLCLMQMEKFEEAVNRFYQLEYMEQRVVPSWRAIAWCNFKMNKLEQADKYYRKILNSEKVNWEDYLNAGHIAWCLGNMQYAVECYNKYTELYAKANKNENADLLKAFDNDRKELLEHGISELDIKLMRDIILSNNI